RANALVACVVGARVVIIALRRAGAAACAAGAAAAPAPGAAAPGASASGAAASSAATSGAAASCAPAGTAPAGVAVTALPAGLPGASAARREDTDDHAAREQSSML